ncbi:hypothetical protein [Litorimonas sp. WD9-15]|uniref:hypothetical protein n=1 Tax=Litorimonas sp. WD9-15 TaxID=3418716 RepID=UPI003D077E52
MKLQSTIGLAIAMACLSACATSPMMASDFEETRESVSVVLMKPDVEVKFDKVGTTETRVDWTEQSEANLKAAIMAHLESTGESVTEFDTATISQEELDQLLALNEQVSVAMGQHAVSIGNTPFLGPLPHKKDRKRELDYSLGEAIAPIKASTDADYAAFLTYRSTIESGGSFLTKIAIGTLTGYTPAGSDFRGTLVSLVNLDDGEIVWLNSKVAGSILAGDARDAGNATKTIASIMDKSPFMDETE